MHRRLLIGLVGGLLILGLPANLSSQEADSLDAAAREAGERVRGSLRSSDAACDGDFDGAMIGTLVGGSPLIFGVVAASFDEDSGEEYLGAVGLGVIGGIVGFWVGLAVDSTQCDVEPPPVP